MQSLKNKILRGEGIELDLGTAAYWFWQAANEDDREAQALIGMCFEFGYGVKKNLKEAEKWYSLAAEKGMNFPKSD